MNILRIILFLVSISHVYNRSTDYDDVIEDKRVKVLVKERKRYQRVRCSRRYTPGSCMDPVRPVWTFVAPLQTCTERLGCPASIYTNRFNSLEECSNMCRDLVYLFMYLQSLDNDTFRVPDEGLESSTRQANVDVMYSEFMAEKGDEHDSDVGEIEDNDTGVDDFRRNFNEALSNLPEENAEYTEKRIYEDSDDRQPLPSRRELMEENELVVPNIDDFQ